MNYLNGDLSKHLYTSGIILTLYLSYCFTPKTSEMSRKSDFMIINPIRFVMLIFLGVLNPNVVQLPSYGAPAPLNIGQPQMLPLNLANIA